MKSMTGFGQGEAEQDGYRVSVEIKTVNHRYFEPSIRMGRRLGALEAEVRGRIKKTVARGKTDVFITCENLSAEQGTVHVNEGLLKSYLEALRDAGRTFGLQDNLTVGDLLRLPEVVTAEEPQDDKDRIRPVLMEALEKALVSLDAMRIREGGHIRDDLLTKIQVLEDCHSQLAAQAPLVVQDYREKLSARLRDLLEKEAVDPGRLETEVAIFADRCAIDEELTRLTSHFAQFRHILANDEPAGRRLDFLTQELNREANTIASKANALAVSQIALTMKNEIEKIREQIQNIE